MTELNQRSKQVRRDAITLSLKNGMYHLGGSLSCIDILIALYDAVLTPQDKFILSKGHACSGLYVLLREKGLNPKLEGHPYRDLVNGINWTSGSMGHGLPAAIGMALARKIKGEPGNIYVIVGDGECQEGTTWESILMAPKYKLDNLVVIMDSNKCQACDFIDSILPLRTPLEAVLPAAGWFWDIVDGHNIDELMDSMVDIIEGKPKFIIANTVKGKGVSYMENKPEWHASYPNPEQVAQAMEELQ